jgi:hypothetical protein
MNLVGVVVPGERPVAIAGRTVTFTDGVFAAATEGDPASGGGSGRVKQPVDRPGIASEVAPDIAPGLFPGQPEVAAEVGGD